MRGAAYTIEEFHNEFLKQGMLPPIQIVREKSWGTIRRCCEMWADGQSAPH